MALRMILQRAEDLVAQLFVERARLEAERVEIGVACIGVRLPSCSIAVISFVA